MLVIASMSESDKLRLANKPDISKFSSSKLFIRSSKSRSSNSMPNNLNRAVMVFMSISSLLMMPISSARLILDKS